MIRSSLVLEAEEHQPFQRVPVMARAIGGQRFVWPALIFEVVVAHRDAVLDALPFADQPGAGDRPVLRWLPAPRRIAAVEIFGRVASAA